MLDKKQWQKMSLDMQMGNIASEIAKAFALKDKDKGLALKYANLVLECFDASIEKMKGAGFYEISKMKEVFCDTFFDFKQFNVSPQSIEAYFLPFALNAAEGFALQAGQEINRKV
jgi:hypothetical protein